MRAVSTDAALSPEALLRRFRDSRDPEPLGALFDLTAPTLLRVALSIAPDAACAENALQETFLAVLESPERWDETRPAMPWLLGILHRQVGKIRRDGARTPDPLRLAPPLQADDPAAAAASREEMARVRAAIDELPEPYRAVAVLRWRHGLDPADIADVRGEPPGTTRSLLSRALEKLRERLGVAAFALFGVPTTRGLAGIRRTLMSKATAAAAATGTTAVVGGIVVMKKIVAACVVAALLGVGAWWTATTLARSSNASQSSGESTAAASSAERKRKRAADVASTGEVAPVDLDKCDRDLDLFGRVIDEDGKPVAGAKIETLRHPWRDVSTEHWLDADDGPATHAAPDGTFAIRLARGEKLDLHVVAAPFGDVVREDCQAGERVEITLRRGATLDVTTVDEAGAPVSAVRVKVRRDTRKFGPVAQTREGVTDAAGHVAVTGLLPGPALVDFIHATLGEPTWQRPVLPVTGTLALRVTMPAGHVVKGRVTDADTGRPIAGASVDTWNRRRPVTTDEDGRYTYFGWTFDDGSMPLVFQAARYGEVYRYDFLRDAEVDVALRRGDRVVGRLLREDGTPVYDAYVGVYGSAAGDRRPGGRQSPSDSVCARTAADGRFDLGGLSRDVPHELFAAAPGLARTRLEFDRHFWTGDAIDLGDVVMKAARSIEGVATDFDGKPLRDAEVSLSTGDDDPARPGSYLRGRMRRTDDLGRFRFPDLAAGTYSASVRTIDAPRGPFTSIELPADRDVLDARVTLLGAGSITVLVVDDLDAPVEGLSINSDVGANVKRDGLLNVWTGSDGRATLRGLPTVPATIGVHRRDGRFIARVGPVAPDGREVRVVARREAEVRGLVRGEDGKPLASYVVAKSHKDGSDAGSAAGDATGAFVVKVPLGEIVDLWARGTTPSAGGSSFTGFEGRLDGVKSPADGLAITLLPVKIVYDRTLTVLVQDSTGVPVPGVEIGVYERDPPRDWKVKTQTDGRARFEGLPNHVIVLNFAERSTEPPQHALDIVPAGVMVTPNDQEVVAKYRAGAAIRGRVVDAQGRAVPDAYVQALTRDGVSVESRGDADGRFVTCGLPGLAHRLTAQGFIDGKPAGGVATDVVPGDAEVTIVVAPTSK